MMKQLEYEVRFTTPAFIGNSTQESQWRTPPFKSLLRQWWRIVWAANNLDFSHSELKRMRTAERDIFGSPAISEMKNQKSRLRIRLPIWEAGRENINRNFKYSYLAYGIELPRLAIGTNNPKILRIAVPEDKVEDIVSSLALINAYGSLGSRSRNGWGSLVLSPHASSPELHTRDLQLFTRKWKEALHQGWPCAVGKDSNGVLVWKIVDSKHNWEDVMSEFSILRKSINRSDNTERYWLSLPTGDNFLDRIGSKKTGFYRLPNAFHFKVQLDKVDSRKLIGIGYLNPSIHFKQENSFVINRSEIESTWEEVIRLLDNRYARCL